MWVSDSVPHTENETHTPSYTRRAILATKIRLKRMGKKFYAFYRVVIMDSRTKRDGRAIEEIGTYNPNTQPRPSLSIPSALSTGSALALSRPSRC